MRCLAVFVAGFILPWSFAGAVTAADQPSQTPKLHPLLECLQGELDYSMQHLATNDGTKPYYLAYTITDVTRVSIAAQLGALENDDMNHDRVLDVDVRVGDYALDSTHQIRGRAGGGRGFERLFGGGTATVSLDDNEAAIRHALWRATDRAFQSAVERYQQVQTNLKTMVEEERKSEDFSREKAVVDSEPDVALHLDRKVWAERVREVSRAARAHPLIYGSSVAVTGSAENRFLVTSEGTRLKTGRGLWRVIVSASTRAEDGMELSQSFIFDATSEDRLPGADEIRTAFQHVIDQVLALRTAPLVEPYTGPAILANRAAGVFFHEIFGHRIEGHRQKDVGEGQTFTNMVGQAILPDFLDVRDDPTQASIEGTDLRGFYRYDDEGVRAARVDLVEKGVLKTFLLSRSPLQGFPLSNGHGRREPGREAVSRQGNLIVHSSNVVSAKDLRGKLADECKKQGKPYGFLFEDITGGFTTTARSGPQAFKVLPVVVYRVYADGRPDELVRGVDIVGTPLSCFSKIMCTGDDPAVFNGSCGAESGWVPVSAVSPSLLVQQIEIERRERSQDKLPILPSPLTGAKPGTSQQ
jgi:predicted Zn-dependent protease